MKEQAGSAEEPESMPPSPFGVHLGSYGQVLRASFWERVESHRRRNFLALIGTVKKE